MTPKETAALLILWADNLDRIAHEVDTVARPVVEGGSPAISLGGSHRLGALSTQLRYNARDLRRQAGLIAVEAGNEKS